MESTSVSEVSEPLIPVSEGYVVRGDLHGSFKNLLEFLVHTGLVSASSQDLETLERIYFKVPPDSIDEKFQPSQQILSKEDIKNFNAALEKITLHESYTSIILLGDDLSDRGNNDGFTLSFIKQLHNLLTNEEEQLVIILSNHVADFLKAYYTELPELWFMKSNFTTAHRSQLLLDRSIQAGLFKRKDIDRLIEEYYLPHLKALAYSIDPKEKKITIITHAPVGLDTLKKIAEQCSIQWDDSNLFALCRTLDKINDFFAEHIRKISEYISMHQSFREPIVDLVWIRYENHVDDFLRVHQQYYESYRNAFSQPEDQESYKSYKIYMKAVFQLSKEEANLLKTFEGIGQAYTEFKAYMDEKLSPQKTASGTQPDYKIYFLHGHCGLDDPIHERMINLDSFAGREDILPNQRAVDFPFLYSSQILGPVDHIIRVLKEHDPDRLFPLLRQDMNNMIERLTKQSDFLNQQKKLLLYNAGQCSDDVLPEFYITVKGISDNLDREQKRIEENIIAILEKFLMISRNQLETLRCFFQGNPSYFNRFIQSLSNRLSCDISMNDEKQQARLARESQGTSLTERVVSFFNSSEPSTIRLIVRRYQLENIGVNSKKTQTVSDEAEKKACEKLNTPVRLVADVYTVFDILVSFEELKNLPEIATLHHELQKVVCDIMQGDSQYAMPYHIGLNIVQQAIALIKDLKDAEKENKKTLQQVLNFLQNPTSLEIIKALVLSKFSTSSNFLTLPLQMETLKTWAINFIAAASPSPSSSSYQTSP